MVQLLAESSATLFCILSCTTAGLSCWLYPVSVQSTRYWLSLYLPLVPPCCNFSLLLSDSCVKSAQNFNTVYEILLSLQLSEDSINISLISHYQTNYKYIYCQMATFIVVIYTKMSRTEVYHCHMIWSPQPSP